MNKLAIQKFTPIMPTIITDDILMNLLFISTSAVMYLPIMYYVMSCHFIISILRQKGCSTGTSVFENSRQRSLLKPLST
jgi:hypothetical protein